MTLILEVFRRLLDSVDAIFIRELHCSEVTETNFNTSACFVYVLSAEIVFCLLPTTKCFPFLFQKCRISREFCCLFTEI